MKNKSRDKDPKSTNPRKAPRLRELDKDELDQVGGGGPRHDVIMQ
ncbi:MAG TPA: hypothetical protein VFU21_33555 [Kofleriaceae bacterium]|nr:hypothetical protein [Kofleriaceae bacterium]